MKAQRRRWALGATLAAGFLFSGALAQTDAQQDWGYGMGPWMMGSAGMMGGAPMGPGMMGGGWGLRGNRKAMCNAMSAHMTGRLAFLKTELDISKSQEPLWNDYENAVRTNAQQMSARCATLVGGENWKTASLPGRLAMHEQFMAAQLDALRAVNKTLKPLYASFNDVQKKTASQLIWCPMGMM